MRIPSLLLLGFFASLSASADWTQWRGNARDGSVDRETAFPESLAEDRLVQLWSAKLDKSYASPIAAGGLVFTLETSKGKTEIARALDLVTGEEKWKLDWAGSMSVPFFARKNGSWVRCTPAVAGGAVFFGGIQDVLVKVDAATGEEIWRIDFKEREGTRNPTFGYVSSPFVDGDALYVQAGNAVARIDAESGDTVWRSMEDNRAMFDSAFSSPVLAEIHGQKQLVVQTRSTLAGLDPSTGDTIWSTPVKAFRGMNILTPTVIGNRVFTATYGGGSFLYDIEKTDSTRLTVTESGFDANPAQQVKLAWSIPKLEGYMASPLVIGEHLYLPGRDQHLYCIAIADGSVAWKSEEKFGQYWSMIHQGGRILALDQKGELILFDADPSEFKLLDRRKVSSEPSWAHVGITGNTVLVRGLENLTAFEWK